jgi:catechol 2,3-dioxygenase-like lactoylglutathione lyase family enzyme
VVNYFIVSDDVERSARFYTEVLGGRVVFSPVPTVVELSNTFIVINAGGGPTDDKPAVTLETPHDPGRASSFVNIRVQDIEAAYAAWSARGAQFLTPPKPHPYETRCYIRDPDGHLIEVGQTTDPKGTGCRLAGHRVRPPRSLDHRRHRHQRAAGRAGGLPATSNVYEVAQENRPVGARRVRGQRPDRARPRSCAAHEQQARRHRLPRRRPSGGAQALGWRS